MSLQLPSWSSTRTTSALMRCSPAPTRSGEVAEGCVWEGERERWSTGQKVTLMNHSLVEMLSLKAWKAKALKHSNRSCHYCHQTITYRKPPLRRSLQEVHQRWRSQSRETWRTETRKSKTFLYGRSCRTNQVHHLLTSKPVSSWDCLVVEWLRNHLPVQGSRGSVFGKSHMPQLLN